MYREQIKCFSHTNVMLYSYNGRTSIVLMVIGSIWCQSQEQKTEIRYFCRKCQDYIYIKWEYWSIMSWSWKIGVACCDREHREKGSTQCDLCLTDLTWSYCGKYTPFGDICNAGYHAQFLYHKYFQWYLISSQSHSPYVCNVQMYR